MNERMSDRKNENVYTNYYEISIFYGRSIKQNVCTLNVSLCVLSCPQCGPIDLIANEISICSH